MLEASPHLGLPAVVERFARGLDAWFARGREDRHDPETETYAHDPTDGVAVLMRDLKGDVIVELRVGAQADGPPVLQERLDGGAGTDQRHRPRLNEPAVQRNGIENLEVRSSADGQPVDDADAVQFGPAARG